MSGTTGLELREGQLLALQVLYNGRNVLLVAKTGYGKTLVMRGYHALLQPGERSVTLVISPLNAIENGQAQEPTERFDVAMFKSFVLNGESKTPTNRSAIARGEYRHVWTSAETAIGSSSEKREDETSYAKESKSKVNIFPYFTSILQHGECQDKLALVATDEIYLCPKDSWGGGFRKIMGVLYLLRAQLNDHTRQFGTTATLTPNACKSIRRSTFREGNDIRTLIYRNGVFLYIFQVITPGLCAACVHCS